MSMLRRRMRRGGFVRPAAAAVCALCALGTGHGAMAASHDTLHDVPGYFSYMSNVEGEIRSYHAAVDGLAQAKADLENARNNLAEARAATADAAKNLVLVGQNLRAAEDHLAAVRTALAVAEEARAARTAEAIAAQQAEADYAPQVYAQRAQVNALSAQESRLTDTGTGSAAGSRRAEVVARVLREVGYEQNRIVDAQIMVEAALAGGSAGTGAEGGTTQIDAISAQLTAAQAALDAVEAHFDELTAAREMAEDAERDARELVADYQQELTASTADLTQLQSDRVEAENYDREARAWASEAARDEVTAQKQLAQSEHELKYLGEGKGYQTGLEYYAWHGDHAGHQLYLPFSYFARTHAGKTKLDYGLSTGYVKSDTGYENGSVSGWTDTQLSVTLRNEKPINRVYYGFGVSVPTGQSRFARYAVVPESLAPFTDFGAGWQYIPSVEVVHLITERDRLTGRLSYTMRSSYDYSKEVPSARVSPGNIFSQEVEYLHAGEKKQYMVQLYHNMTGRAEQDAVDTDSRTITGKNNYRDGDDWELRYFHNQKVSKKDEVRFYAIYALTEAASGIASQSVARQYYGLGLRHRISEKLAWQIMAHYVRVGNTSDPLRTALNTGGGFRRLSLVGGVEWKISERRNFTFQTERFVRSDEGGFGYNGWAFTLWYQETL
mgnify:FL=1